MHIQFVLGQLETKTNTEISFSFRLSLFYSIPSLSPHGLTDRQTEEQLYPMWAGHLDRVPPGKQHYPRWAGHPDRVPPGKRHYPRWAGHPDRVPPNFFSSYSVVSVFGSGGK